MATREYSRETLLKFYKLINGTDFETITEERKKELDEDVKNKRYFFTSGIATMPALMSRTADKMIISNYNNDEKAYFYVTMVDPNLNFLRAYESISKADELKDYCLKKFYIYDKTLINLEKRLNKKFTLFQEEELWETIDKDIKKSR